MREGMQGAHMRLASDFEEGHMRIVRQENHMRGERLGAQRKVEWQQRVGGHAMFWVYEKVLVLVACMRDQIQADYTRVEEQ